ncbi:MAG: hypothetical protein Q8N76_04075 [Candidatus Omnitrophota bacterium]|nr:hypothetical protein [Candidatus Omnitrophota bacterium]
MRKILIFYILIFSAFSFSITLAVETKKEIKNKNGKANTWAYYDDNNRPVRIESDRNNDNKIDLWIFYGKSGARVTQIDRNFDARPDMYSHYQYGQRVKLEIDSDYDGNLDQINEYIDNKVVKMQKLDKKTGKLETVFDRLGLYLSQKKNTKEYKQKAEPLSDSKTLP